MDRSLFPDDIEVDGSALQNTESTKIAQILARTLAVAQTGVVSGLTVSVNAVNNTLVDVQAGQAIVQSGELAILSALSSANPLASNVNGVVNLVLLQYVETPANPEPSEDGTTIEDTIITSAGVISIMTQTAYNALTPAQQEPYAIVASITATGGAISPSLVVQSQSFVNVLAPSQPTATTGVEIVGIDFSTPPGTAILDFDAPPPNVSDPLIPAPRIRWTAPGDGGPGTYVNIPVNGNYTLVATSGHTLTVSVISTSLPLVDVVENIIIESLYSKPVPRFTASDYLHRTYLGSGTPSEKNPHALTFADLGGSPNQQVEQHQDLMHSNGILRSSNSIFLSTAVILVAGPSPDYISITGPIAGDTYFVNGVNLQSLANNQITFLTSVSPDISLYDLLLDESGNPLRSLRVQHPGPVGSVNVSGVAIIDISDSIGVGSYNLVYNMTANTLQWNNGPAVLMRANGNYTLYGSDGNWVVANVSVSGAGLGFGNLPTSGGPIFTDSISVFAIVDRTINFLIANVVWDGAHNLGWTTSLINPRQTTDKRLLGTLGIDKVRDDELTLNKDHAVATYIVGDGISSFGDLNGSSAIQAALDLMTSNGVAGTIFVRSGTYDPFTVSSSDIKIIGLGGVIIDGVNSSETPGACVTMNASRLYISNLKLQNAAYGISQMSGNDCQGDDLLFGSGIGTFNFSWTAGSRNRYRSTTKQFRLVSSNTTLIPFDELVVVDASAGAVTLTLPLSTNCSNHLAIKKKDETTNLVTVMASGGDTVDYATSDATDIYLDSLNYEPSATQGWLGV